MPSWRRLTPAVRLQLAGATIITITTIIVISCSAQAQSPSVQLPGVVVESQKAKAAKVKAKGPKAATKSTQEAPVAPAQSAVALPDGAVIAGPQPVVETTAGPTQGYRALSADGSTKTRTPIERLPYSMVVLPKDIIEDQRSLSVDEVLRNASGVQGENKLVIGNTTLQPLTIRGFGAEQWLDGLAVTYTTGFRDALAHVERIEVLKGPNAILYGGGPGAPIGGAVNVISKLPTPIAHSEYGFTVGSHGYLRPYFDINQPISADGTVLFRMTGEYLSAGSFVDVIETKNYFINPSLTFTNKTDTSLTIQARLSRAEQQAYPGLPVTGTLVGSFRLDPDTFLGPRDMRPSISEVQGLTVTFDHKFNPYLTANIKARVDQSKFAQYSQLLLNGDFTGGTPLLPPSTWALANTELVQDQTSFAINPSLQAKFNFGASRNTVTLGADYSRVTDKGHMYSDFLGNGCLFFISPLCPLGATVDLTNPIFSTPFTRPSPLSPEFVPFFDFDNVYTTKGAYAQIQSSIFERVHLMGGLRLASLEIDYLEKGLGRFVTEETKVLPRAGVVVDVLPGLSVFASYSEGMRGVPFSTAFLQPEPELSAQFETGIKFNLGAGLTGSAGYFRIERSNVAVGLGLGVAARSEQLSQGFEADVLWQPTRNLKILASYAFTNAEFADDVQVPLGVLEGNKIPAVPEQSGRLWANYSFDEGMLRGWSVGAGIYLASGSFVDAANLYKTDGYFTVDAKIGYATETYSAALHLKNLTDEAYFTPYTWLGGQVAPGEGRTIYGTFAYKF